MFKKLIIIIYLVTALYNKIQPASQELSELTVALSQLQNINSKFLIKEQIPGKEFYTKLEQAILDALNGDDTILNAYGANQSAETGKYMVSVVNKAQSHLQVKKDNKFIAYDIVMMVQIYDNIRKKYNPADKLIITSVATGAAIQENILLRTLHHFDYRSIIFYAIDPSQETTNAIQKFKEDLDFIQAKYEFQQFADTKYYVEEIIIGKKQLPNICITVGPIPFVPSENAEKPNYCTKDDSILILPNYINELSIATIDEYFIENINTLLKQPDNSEIRDLTLIKAKLIESLDTRSDSEKRFFAARHKCAKSIFINFLEIIKLASTPGRDCIAYYCSANSIISFNDIASKSIAQLFLELIKRGEFSVYDFVKMQMQLKQKKLILWTYNVQTHQFEKQNI